MPNSLDALVSTSQRLKAGDRAGIAMQPQRGYKIFEEWANWLFAAGGSIYDDQGKPTLVVDWEDMTGKPYLMEVLGSGILRDMVMDVVLEKNEPQKAAEKAQKRLEDLMKSKGYLKG